MHFAGVDVEPEGVNVGPPVPQAAVHEGVGGHVLHLHQGVHHRDLRPRPIKSKIFTTQLDYIFIKNSWQTVT